MLEEYRKALPALNILSGGFDPKRNEEVNTLQERVRDLEDKLEAAEAASSDDDLQRQLTEQQRQIDEMTPLFEMAKRIKDMEMKVDRLIESAEEE
ncbi:hypothetical protein ES703_94326 [subsurface metagenome]